MSHEHSGASPMRTRSPLKSAPIEDATELYKTAMSKLYEAAWKFDRAKNEDLLKTLDNRELPKTQFRTILRAGMNCKLSAEELDELMPLFDNNGSVDGCEFILLFYRLRYEHRSKLLTERLAKDRMTLKSQKIQQSKKLESEEMKVHITLCEDYTEQDLKSSMKKIVDAAVKYDRMMPGAVQLDAFECEYMVPNVFREQLKLVFNVQLSLPELSAFIRNLNKDNNNGENVNCASFIVKFFRMGFQEKSRRLHAVWAEKKRIAEEKERKRKEELAELEAKNSLKMSMNFTPEDKERAVSKLRTAARLYDKTTPGAMSMKSFEVKEMAPHVFKEQLKRIFNLTVNAPEMGALMSVFDVNGDGAVTCEEFTKVFLNMGFEEREKELRDSLEKQRQIEHARAEAAARKEAELANKNTMKVSYTYTPQEYDSAIHKLLEAAWRYDKNMPGAPCLDAFEAQHMEPHVLKEQLRRAFYMKVTPQELGALMHYFDPEGQGRIECSVFLKKFFKTGFEERNRKSAQWRQHQKELNAHRAKLEALKLNEAENKMALAVSSTSNTADSGGNGNIGGSYEEEDFQSAFSKLTEGAIKYNKSGPGAVGLEGFEAISMPPHVFKEQLKLVFNVKITVPELWALVAYFDKDNTGSVNCKHFINQFLRTGFEERERIRLGWRREQQKRREKEDQKEEAKKAETAKKAWAEVDFDFLESDFDAALHKFVHLCHQFDRRMLGPAGLSAFDGETLNPAEFRETIKRTFNLKVTPRELGALVIYFDVGAKKVVNCAAFLNAFVQVRVQCEELKGKADEYSRLADLETQLKETYRSRIARQNSTDSKPWRQAGMAPTTGLSTKKVPKRRRDAPPPSSAVEKYKLRVMVGRRTGRMDLASKECWAITTVTTDGESKTSADNSSNDVNSMNKDAKTSPAVKTAADAKTVAQTSDDFDLQQPADDNNNVTEGVDDQRRSAEDEVAQLVEASERQQELEQQEEAVMFGAAEEVTSAADESEEMTAMKPKSSAPPMPDFRLNLIPSEVLKLTELTELWLCNNLVTAVPSAIGDMKQLKVLSLSKNRLESLPPEICLLENLRSLYLGGNALTCLPNLMGRLRQLRELNVSQNRLTEFPLVLTGLSRLMTLDLSSNLIASPLPPSLTDMRSLTLLNMENNRLGPQPCAVLARTPWLDVKGCVVPLSKAAAHEFAITPDEEFELMGMLKNRAAIAIAANARRKKLPRGMQ